MANCACAANNRRAVTAATAVWRRTSLTGGQGTVVVAVVAVRVVKMARHSIVHMIAVRHRFVTASGPVDMARLVPTAAVVGGAAVGVLA